MISSTNTRYHKNFSYYANDNVIGRSLELYGEYGQQEIDFLLWLANCEYTVYDIGANIGVYTTALASQGAKVYAFEPNPKNFSLLRQNTQELANVQCYNMAIGQSVGRILVEDFDPQEPGNYGSLSTRYDRGVEVDCMALDYMDIPIPNLIKIDVEGRELDVLQGCKKKIAESVPCIVYEAHETKQFAEIYQFLKQFNYRLFWLRCMNFNEANFKNNSHNVFDRYATFSVVAWPESWPDSLKAKQVLGPDDTAERFVYK